MTNPNPELLTKETDLQARRVILIPAHNEERFIGSVVLQARQYAETVIVIDDGSSDATAHIAKAAGAMLIQHDTNKGKAAALTSGIFYLRLMEKEILENFQVVVLMDGDGQHHCSDIPVVTAPIFSDEADIVIGSRFLEVKSRIPRWRVFGQHTLTAVTNLSSGNRVTDSQSGFRALSIKALSLFDFDSQGFSVESEMQFLAKEHHLRVQEVPIKVTYDNTLKRNPFSQAFSVLNGILTLTGQYRPLLFFGGSGIFLLLVGMGWGITVVSRFYQSGQLAVGYAMICVLLSVLGMILISTGFTLHSVRALLIGMLRNKEP